jgi:hypothetical protein
VELCIKPRNSKSCPAHKKQTRKYYPLARGRNMEAFYLSRVLGRREKKSFEKLNSQAGTM